MPDYDEYGMAYKDRSALAHPDHEYWTPRGTGRRHRRGHRRCVAANAAAGRGDRRDLDVDLRGDDARVVAAAEEYARFLGRELDLRAATVEW